MNVPRRGPRRRTLLFAIIFLIIALLVVSTFTVGQGTKKLNPRNDPKIRENASLGLKNGNNVANDCWAHHKGEGMRDTHIVYPIMPEQLQVNVATEVLVQIINPWKQELRDISLEVSIPEGEEQILSIEGAAASPAAAQDISLAMEGCVGHWDTNVPRPPGEDCPVNRTFAFDIPPGAAAIIIEADLYPNAPPNAGGGAATNDSYDLRFHFAGTSITNARHFGPGNPEAAKWSLHRNYTQALSSGGRGLVELRHTAGLSSRTLAHIDIKIVMGGTGGGGGERAYEIDVPEETVPKGQAIIVPVKITPFAKGKQTLTFHVRAENYYKHQIATTPNEDHYDRYAIMDEETDLVTGTSIIPQRAAVVGDTFRPSQFSPATATLDAEDWRFVAAETSGFAAAGLLLPSLLLGGTYGKGSRRFFNNLLGGAKRRVMYHNLLSLGLSLVALVHIWLFMLEVRYTIVMGVMWGGLAALSLLVLGLTGYYQVPLIQRHGYKWWRYTHLVFGLLVVFFVTWHSIQDGPDFFFIEQRMPQWINDLNFAQK